MTELTWQDPPSRTGGKTRAWEPVVEQLKANPGKWALVAEDWTYSAPPAAFRQAGCEATARRNKAENGAKKTWSIYARYPVKKSPAPSPAKAQVEKAANNGTALTPPPTARAPLPPPKNSGGYSQFLANQRAGTAAARS